MRRYPIALISLIALLVGCAEHTNTSSERLQRLFEEAWSFRLEESPTFATYVGVHEFNDRLPSVSFEDLERRHQKNLNFLQQLRSIDLNRLEGQDRINYLIFERQLSDQIQEFEFAGYLFPLTSETGFHTGFARLPEWVPFNSIQDYHNYLSRLRSFSTYTVQHIALLQKGLDSGMVLPRIVMKGYESTILPHIVEKAEDSVFYSPFRHLPDHFAEIEKQDLEDQAKTTITETVIPSYKRFLEFMTEAYIPGCRDSLGISSVPNGDQYYAFLVRHHTTLNLTPEEVHQIGQEHVARIRNEMMEVIQEAEFDGSLEEFIHYLRSESRFYAETPEELLKEASRIAKRIDAKLPSLFKTLPRLPYGVEPVPEHIAPKYTAGRYVGAPLGGTKAGTYWVNTYALESRPLYSLTSLTLHEAVPGHHLQNALRQELTDLPNFRRFSGINAYGEGWGLYSEWLGIEAGLYDDPYDHFGRLTYEMWRACRLVVDTGIHAMDWSRDQAVEFLAANTALSLHEIGTEVDRYISWPGQALAYKIGEIKIRELRQRAERELGELFDVREFHDVILLSGPVPLDILEEQVIGFIEKSRNVKSQP
jgi:uncharacterized protein (DUF885 family)